MDSAHRVVVVGHVCIDENVTAHGTVRAAGSPATFIGRAFHDRGVAVEVAAPHGHDFEDLGTGLRMLDPAGRDRSLVFVNELRGARRRQAVRNASAAAIGHPSPAVLEALSGASAVLFTPLLPDPAPSVVAEHLAAAPTRALRLMLPQGFLRRIDPVPDARGDHAVIARPFEEAAALLPFFDVAVLSDEDPPGDADSTVAAWSRAHPETAIVLTRGARGASAYLAGARHDEPAHEVGPIAAETLVGAGDTFSAELALALLELGAATGAGGARSAAIDAGSLRAAVARANRATALRLESRPQL